MGFKVSAAAGVLLLLSGIAFKLYYDKAQAQIAALKQEIITLQQNEELLKKEIAEQNEQLQEQLRKSLEQFEQINLLNERNQQANADIANLRSKFAKHDLNYLSLRKPKLIEKIVNKGTAEVLTNLENLTEATKVYSIHQ